jgi:hypothetical protein
MRPASASWARDRFAHPKRRERSSPRNGKIRAHHHRAHPVGRFPRPAPVRLGRRGKITDAGIAMGWPDTGGRRNPLYRSHAHVLARQAHAHRLARGRQRKKAPRLRSVTCAARPGSCVSTSPIQQARPPYSRPAGATPRTAPSAGSTTAVALASLLTQRPSFDLAMTGGSASAGGSSASAASRRRSRRARPASSNSSSPRATGTTGQVPDEVRKKIKSISSPRLRIDCRPWAGSDARPVLPALLPQPCEPNPSRPDRPPAGRERDGREPAAEFATRASANPNSKASRHHPRRQANKPDHRDNRQPDQLVIITPRRAPIAPEKLLSSRTA